MPKKERTNKTPAQRAQEQADVANRKVDRLSTKVEKARADLDELESEYSAATVERNAYAELAEKLGPGKGAEVAPVPPMTAEEA